MKKLITIFLLLFIVTACTTQKHKSKEKTKNEFNEKEVYSTSADVLAETQTTSKKTDSTVQKTDLSSSKSFASIAQNLTLKNNGKCVDGGEIRFLKFTDAQGNMTEVPVNDNTDLSFNSAAELSAENQNLKTAFANLYAEKSDLETKLKAEIEENQNSQKSDSSASTIIETDKTQNSFMSYVWCIILTILIWEIGNLYFKKLI